MDEPDALTPWPLSCWDCEHREEENCDLKDRDIVENNKRCDDFKIDVLLVE